MKKDKDVENVDWYVQLVLVLKIVLYGNSEVGFDILEHAMKERTQGYLMYCNLIVVSEEYCWFVYEQLQLLEQDLERPVIDNSAEVLDFYLMRMVVFVMRMVVFVDSTVVE